MGLGELITKKRMEKIKKKFEKGELKKEDYIELEPKMYHSFIEQSKNIEKVEEGHHFFVEGIPHVLEESYRKKDVQEKRKTFRIEKGYIELENENFLSFYTFCEKEEFFDIIKLADKYSKKCLLQGRRIDYLKEGKNLIYGIRCGNLSYKIDENILEEILEDK